MSNKNPKVIDQIHSEKYSLYHGDSCEVIKGLPDNSIHYSIFSPPFSSLYTYSASDRDMGNCKSLDEFSTHFEFLAKELHRVIKTGRLLSFHCMQLPASKARDGYIGLKDFRGDLIRIFQSAGFVFHSEVCIWKDPVTAMQRTKAIGLLHKQVCKDSALSRQGIPDYLVTMRKLGDNTEPVEGGFDEYYGENIHGLNLTADRLPDGSIYYAPVDGQDMRRSSIDIWQRYASPVWMDIDPSDTLQKDSARANEDERHICPLQKSVIRRGMQLWTNPGDAVLDPFNGIGSTGHICVEQGRKYIGIELKDSYFNASAKNLDAVATKPKQMSLMEMSA
jgi:DNA modification methylase